jgi:hypothetical protein
MTPGNSFFIQYPVLATYIDSVMKAAVDELSTNILNVRLFPVLAILCRLSPGLETDSEINRYAALFLQCAAMVSLSVCDDTVMLSRFLIKSRCGLCG